MAGQYQGHTYSQQSKQPVSRTSSNKRKKRKKIRGNTLVFIATTLLLGIIIFAICFFVGIVCGPNLPI